MAVNKGTSKLKLCAGSPCHNDTGTLSINQEHLETGSALTSAGDIEWQWTSPIGTVSNVKVRSDKRPTGLQQMKHPSKSISPVSNDFPRKRKLIKSDDTEAKLGSSTLPDSLHFIPMYNTDNTSQLAASRPSIIEYYTQRPKEDYCKLFNDEEDDMDKCLMQCSQFVEDNLSQNPTGIIPLQATTPRSTRVHSVTPITRTVSLNLSDKPHNFFTKEAVKVQNKISNDETKVNANTGKGNADSDCSSLSLPTFGQGKSSLNINNNQVPSLKEVHQPLNTTTQETPAQSKKLISYEDSSTKATKYEINDSFDEILMTFCEENVELLSQPTNYDQHNENIPLNVPNNHTSSSSSKISVTKAPESHTLSIKPQDVTVKTSSHLPLPVSKYEQLNLDDDFLQPDLLKLLETVEANSQPPAVSSMPHTCTPQEIENKRREAKVKLERKKMAKISLGHTRNKKM